MKKSTAYYITWIVFLSMIAINAVAQFVLNHEGSYFFGSKWWSSWFPVYLVIFSFFVIGANSNDSTKK